MVTDVGSSSNVMNLKSLEWDKRTTLVLENTRELESSKYKVIYLIYYSSWSVLATVHPTLNDHE